MSVLFFLSTTNACSLSKRLVLWVESVMVGGSHLKKKWWRKSLVLIFYLAMLFIIFVKLCSLSLSHSD